MLKSNPYTKRPERGELSKRPIKIKIAGTPVKKVI